MTDLEIIARIHAWRDDSTQGFNEAIELLADIETWLEERSQGERVARVMAAICDGKTEIVVMQPATTDAAPPAALQPTDRNRN